MRRIRTTTPVLLAGVTAAAVLAACGSGGGSADSTGSGAAVNTAGGEGGSGGGKVTMTWWHNGTAQPLLGIWKQTAADYSKAHPGVTIKISPIQNEQFTTKVPLALQSSNPPDVYFNQGDYLNSASYYARIFDGEFGPPAAKELLIQNAILALQKPSDRPATSADRSRGTVLLACENWLSGGS